MRNSSDRKKHLLKKWSINILLLIAILGMIFALGPKPDKPDFSSLTIPSLSHNLVSLEDSIIISESLQSLKPDNAARIVWHTPFQKTPFSIVYLHGNAASQEEGDPIHEALAHRYGCNLYLARLADHGLQSEDPMMEISVEEWMQSALDAITIGNLIGDSVIVLSTSTGSTLGLYLEAKFPDLADAHIMLSPNIDLYDPRSSLLAKPWGLQIARMIMGSKYYGWKPPGAAQQYWYTRYRIEGLVTLKSMIDHTMTEATFEKVKDPMLMLYYYSNEDQQDQIVSVKRMKEMFDQIGTPAASKKQIPLPDAGTHIIGSDIFNNNLASIWTPTVTFCETVLKIKPVNDTDWKPFIDQRTQ